MSQRTADILREARKLIEREDLWAQGTFEVHGRRCMSGALRDVGVMSFSHCPAYAALLRATCAEALCDWNDDPYRTHAEVLAAFDAAIDAEESAP